jgi:hypothetical protein
MNMEVFNDEKNYFFVLITNTHPRNLDLWITIFFWGEYTIALVSELCQ